MGAKGFDENRELLNPVFVSATPTGHVNQMNHGTKSKDMGVLGNIDQDSLPEVPAGTDIPEMEPEFCAICFETLDFQGYLLHKEKEVLFERISRILRHFILFGVPLSVSHPFSSIHDSVEESVHGSIHESIQESTHESSQESIDSFQESHLESSQSIQSFNSPTSSDSLCFDGLENFERISDRVQEIETGVSQNPSLNAMPSPSLNTMPSPSLSPSSFLDSSDFRGQKTLLSFWKKKLFFFYAKCLNYIHLILEICLLFSFGDLTKTARSFIAETGMTNVNANTVANGTEKKQNRKKSTLMKKSMTLKKRKKMSEIHQKTSQSPKKRLSVQEKEKLICQLVWASYTHKQRMKRIQEKEVICHPVEVQNVKNPDQYPQPHFPLQSQSNHPPCLKSELFKPKEHFQSETEPETPLHAQSRFSQGNRSTLQRQNIRQQLELNVNEGLKYFDIPSQNMHLQSDTHPQIDSSPWNGSESSSIKSISSRKSTNSLQSCSPMSKWLRRQFAFTKPTPRIDDHLGFSHPRQMRKGRSRSLNTATLIPSFLNSSPAIPSISLTSTSLSPSYSPPLPSISRETSSSLPLFNPFNRFHAALEEKQTPIQRPRDTSQILDVHLPHVPVDSISHGSAQESEDYFVKFGPIFQKLSPQSSKAVGVEEKEKKDCKPNHELIITPCDHIFHQSCLQQWVLLRSQCPTCRAKLPLLHSDLKTCQSQSRLGIEVSDD